MCVHTCLSVMVVCVCVCVRVPDNQLFCLNRKGHSLSESLYVHVPISVCDSVLTAIVAVSEESDL